MSFIEKDSTNLLPVLLRLQRRIEGVKREIHRDNGKALCSKCGSRLRGDGDELFDPWCGGWFPYAICCHVCGERVDKQIFQNWLQSEARIKLELGLRPRKEPEMPKCRRCHQEKAHSDFGMWGSKARKTCKDCEEKETAALVGRPPTAPAPPLEGDFGRMFAAIKKEGERDGAKKMAADIIEFLKQKYMEVENS
jgi:hypothetical protein